LNLDLHLWKDSDGRCRDLCVRYHIQTNFRAYPVGSLTGDDADGAWNWPLKSIFSRRIGMRGTSPLCHPHAYTTRWFVI